MQLFFGTYSYMCLMLHTRDRDSPALCRLGFFRRPISAHQLFLTPAPLRSSPTMVNFFTTVVGIFTRLIKLLMAKARLITFIIWLHIRDLYYCVRDRSPFLPTAES